MSKIAGCLLLLCLLPLSVSADELPGDSVYHVQSRWLDQDKQSLEIGEFRDKVQVLAFVYTYCEHSCPVILAELKKIRGMLGAAQKKETQFLLISLDPKRDTPEVLNRYMVEHDMKSGDWNMLSGDPGDVLELAALVGVRYRPMDMDGGDIAHSNMITVLDKVGRIHYQKKGLGQSIDDVVKAIGVAVQE